MAATPPSVPSPLHTHLGIVVDHGGALVRVLTTKKIKRRAHTNVRTSIVTSATGSSYGTTTPGPTSGSKPQTRPWLHSHDIASESATQHTSYPLGIMEAMRRLSAMLLVTLTVSACSRIHTAVPLIARPVPTTLSGPRPTAVPVTKPGATLVFLKSEGTASTDNFTVPSRSSGWSIVALFSCSARSRTPESDLWITIYHGQTNRDDTADPSVITHFAPRGKVVANFHDTGIFYITTTGGCPWSVEAVLSR